MTDWVQWFREHLKSSGDGFVWAFQEIGPALQHRLPPDPDYMGTWSPARHIWHVTEYDRDVALPSMRQWLGDSTPDLDILPDEDIEWPKFQDRPADELVAAFLEVRQAQILLLDQLTAVDWTAPRETVWGLQPLVMVATKTYQHTFEHGDTLLRMRLWWRGYDTEDAES